MIFNLIYRKNKIEQNNKIEWIYGGNMYSFSNMKKYIVQKDSQIRRT